MLTWKIIWINLQIDSRLSQLWWKVLKDQLAIVMLNSINDKHRNLKIALKYGRDEITTEIIIIVLRNRILELKSESGENQSREK